MQERRIQRLESLIKEKVASVLTHDMADPRLGLVTVTRVKLDRELSTCEIFWSVFGDEKKRRVNARTLQHAAGYVRREIAGILHTRNVPFVTFVYDESVAGELRVQRILDRLREERATKEADAPTTAEDAPPPPDADPPAIPRDAERQPE